MYVDVHGISLNVQVLGAGPPVVILHGWGDSSVNWYNFAEKLQDSYQLYLIDLPGFGDSAAPKEPWGISDYTDCVKNFIEVIGIENPYIIGHSNGGKIACNLLANGQDSQGLMLVAASGLDKPKLKVKLKIYLYKMVKFIFSKFGILGERVIESFKSKLGSSDYKSSGEMRATLVKLVSYKLFQILHKIMTPTLIVWGQRDEQLHFSQAKIFRKLIPNSYIRIIWEGGHNLNIFNSDELSHFFKEFSVLKEHFNE